MIDTNRIVEWLQQIVQIPTVSPAQAGDRTDISGEARLATKIAGWFEAFGAEVQAEEVLPNRPNVYGIWRGQSDRWLAVDIHMDTVGVAQMRDDPFDGRVENGRVYGRGAVDTKASLGVMLALLEALHKSGQTLRANLLIVATIDEETGQAGARAFAEWVHRQNISLSQLIVAEPTLCGPVYGHKGVMNGEMVVDGVSAHTAKPELGKNAIAAAAHLIVALEAENEGMIATPAQTELGTGRLTVSLINGGNGLNIVPDSCRLSFNQRILPGETKEILTDRLQKLIDQHCPQPVTMNVFQYLAPFYQSPDTPFVRQLSEWSGQQPAVVPYATNACAYPGLADETVILGPGSIDQAHGRVEWVAISELEKLAGMYTRWWGIDM